MVHRRKDKNSILIVNNLDRVSNVRYQGHLTSPEHRHRILYASKVCLIEMVLFDNVKTQLRSISRMAFVCVKSLHLRNSAFRDSNSSIHSNIRVFTFWSNTILLNWRPTVWFYSREFCIQIPINVENIVVANIHLVGNK